MVFLQAADLCAVCKKTRAVLNDERQRREAQIEDTLATLTGCCKCRSSLLQSRIRGPSILLVHGVMSAIRLCALAGSNVSSFSRFSCPNALSQRSPHSSLPEQITSTLSHFSADLRNETCCTAIILLQSRIRGLH